MRDDLFEQLVESLREALAFERGDPIPVWVSYRTPSGEWVRQRCVGRAELDEIEARLRAEAEGGA